MNMGIIRMLLAGMQFNASYVSSGSHGNFQPEGPSAVALRRVKTVYRREFESSNLIIPITRLKVMEVVGQGILVCCMV